MTATDSEALAVQMGRPGESLEAFARLTPQQIAALSEAIAQAETRERAAIDAALRDALPWPLSTLLLKILRDGQ